MFERFTERARQVVVLAREEARETGHTQIGSEHILVGLLREGEGLAFLCLDHLGVSLDDVRKHIPPPVDVRQQMDGMTIPWSDMGKRALELSLREALSLGHSYIGTEHILLGLVRNPACQASRILEVLFNLDDPAAPIRNEIIRLLTRSKEPVSQRVVVTAPRPAVVDILTLTRRYLDELLALLEGK